MFGRLFSALTLASVVLLAFPAAAHADVEDFEYASWDQRVSLDLDAEGRAVAQVTETIVADFPEFDQNRGMVRGVPQIYDNARLSPSNFNVVNERGEPVPFTLDADDDFRVVLTGDDSYVHGLQTYVITYTLQNVIHVPGDAPIDEFYWDLLPLSREQPIREFSATVAFSPRLANALSGPASCYSGEANSTASCSLQGPQPTADGGAEFILQPLALPANSGVTVAIALAPGTVVQPTSREKNFATDVLPIGIGAGGVGLAAAAGILTARHRKRARTATGVIIAQYDVPDSLPPILVPAILEGTKAAIPAEFIHLAVRGAIRVEDGEQPKQPVFRLLDASRAADPLDARALVEIFGAGSPVGTALPLPKSDTDFSSRMSALSAFAQKDAKQRGLLAGQRAPGAARLGLIGVGIALIGVALSAFGLFTGHMNASGAFAISVFALILSAIVAIASSIKWPTHTPAGAEAREYLLGVREFIRVAEADRLQMLQSYSGADRQGVEGAQVVHIYERLLPYAMLFGLEKEWGKVLQLAYETQHTAPLWYPGFALGSQSFDQSISKFSQYVGSSASYSSSSSSGSGGGGFSGGGGGGGFSGGR
ncbi:MULTISPECIES: DUF2207 domain-containing protein [unclassified Leucobacter]|uniref:DUF2207 domain-containing protein n=1 Tax=unclassified Leucobacter TaxID=2621730 RepID=UPI00165D46EC|nr:MULTISPECIES: DUF2207 domain-containing protein [unclassified Leucobacter]MBC9926855.1 DUF2207 domain-containing protein [Leucobacter sp. cx-169]MBC9935183.1 DUF2207 domain-containing protein [Leucobacter sp. cx-87]